MKCGACKRDCRSTSLAFVAEPDGGMRRARVCGTCFNGAIHIVPAVTQVTKGVDETKMKRRDAAEATKAAAKKFRKLALTYTASARADGVGDWKRDTLETQARALEQAADILDAGDY